MVVGGDVTSESRRPGRVNRTDAYDGSWERTISEHLASLVPTTISRDSFRMKRTAPQTSGPRKVFVADVGIGGCLNFASRWSKSKEW